MNWKVLQLFNYYYKFEHNIILIAFCTIFESCIQDNRFQLIQKKYEHLIRLKTLSTSFKKNISHS